MEKNYVQVVGEIWMPETTTGATQYTLSQSDMNDIELIADKRWGVIAGGSDEITREDVAEWLTTHSGDFRSVTDFCASIGGVEIEWDDLENAFMYSLCMYEDDED